MNIRIPQSGNAARIAEAYLRSQGLELKHTQALELIARLHGYSDFQAMRADPNYQEPLALVAESSSSFKLVGPTPSSIYVTAETIDICIEKSKHGVSVSLLPSGVTADECLDSAVASYEDANPSRVYAYEAEGFIDRRRTLDALLQRDLSADLARLASKYRAGLASFGFTGLADICLSEDDGQEDTDIKVFVCVKLKGPRSLELPSGLMPKMQQLLDLLAAAVCVDADGKDVVDPHGWELAYEESAD